MSALAQQQLAAVRAYRAARPDVDWDTNVVMLLRVSDGTYEAYDHRYEPEELVSWCCDPDNCPTHKEER